MSSNCCANATRLRSTTSRPLPGHEIPTTAQALPYRNVENVDASAIVSTPIDENVASTMLRWACDMSKRCTHQPFGAAPRITCSLPPATFARGGRYGLRARISRRDCQSVRSCGPEEAPPMWLGCEQPPQARLPPQTPQPSALQRICTLSSNFDTGAHPSTDRPMAAKSPSFFARSGSVCRVIRSDMLETTFTELRPSEIPFLMFFALSLAYREFRESNRLLRDLMNSLSSEREATPRGVSCWPRRARNHRRGCPKSCE